MATFELDPRVCVKGLPVIGVSTPVLLKTQPSTVVWMLASAAYRRVPSQVKAALVTLPVPVFGKGIPGTAVSVRSARVAYISIPLRLVAAKNLPLGEMATPSMGERAPCALESSV